MSDSIAPASASVALVLPPFVPELFDAIYGSLPVLGGVLAAAGFAPKLRDLNRGWIEDWVRGDGPKAAYERAAVSLRMLDGRDTLEPFEQEAYARCHMELLAAAFLRRNQKRLTAPTGALIFQLDGERDVTAFCARALPEEPDEGVSEELGAWLAEKAAEIVADAPLLVAISVPMGPQLEPAIALAMALRAQASGLFVCLGGPVPSLLSEAAREQLLSRSGADALCLWEGEETLPQLATALAAGAPLDGVPNLQRPGAPAPETVRLASLNDLPAPLWAPELVDGNPHAPLMAIVARGCYWGRCAYCDYVNLYGPGPYRQRPAAAVVAELVATAAATGRRVFDLTTESLSPGFARRFCRELRSAGLDISWSSYLRVDEGFDRELLADMVATGCRAVTVGVESACDRLLELVDKGTTRAATERFLDRLLDAGLRVGVNMIPDLPSATAAEALASLEVLEARADRLASVSVFPFALTRTSRIGRAPAEWGLELVAGPDDASSPASSGEREGSYKGFQENDLAFRDPAGMSPEEKAEVFGRYAALSERIRTRARRARAAALKETIDQGGDGQPGVGRFRFRRDDVLVTPCRFPPREGATEAVVAEPSLVLYDVPNNRLLAIPEVFSPLFVTASSLKTFRIEDLVPVWMEAADKTPAYARATARQFLEQLIDAGVVEGV